MTDTWSGRKVTEARAIVVTWLPAPCGKCKRTVTADEPWNVGHKISRWERPDLMLEVSNWQPEHRLCSDRSGQAEVIRKARAEGARDALNAKTSSDFSRDDDAEQPPRLPAHTPAPLEVRDGLSWAELCQDAPAWLSAFLAVPDDASPPLYVSAVHAEAVNSYGPAAIDWMESSLLERGRPLRLRWWQKLALVLQLQHRSDGSLCFRTVLESGPRRIGKSVRLRGTGLWRLRHGPELFEPDQLIVHTGKDLAIVREVLRKAWPWADAQDDWTSKRGMTEPEVAYRETNRWVARSKDATTGYDCCLALVDESWDVKPSSVDDDLEPSMLERESAQLVLTSTAHRRSTSLMPGRILDVLATDDGETMILLWGAPPGADIGDPKVWRAASPYWSADRAQMMTTKYAKALAGQQDPEFDDPDPLQGFRAQYLNQWILRRRRSTRGQGIVSSEAWGRLAQVVTELPPVAAAIESWFDQGVTLTLAYRDGDRVQVRSSPHVDLDGAADLLRESGYRGKVTVGASLMTDPALARFRRVKGEARVIVAVQDLARMIAEDVIRHDGSEHLTEQVLAVRTLPGADGPRMASSARADAVKTAVWAARAARRNLGGAGLGMVLPSAVGR